METSDPTASVNVSDTATKFPTVTAEPSTELRAYRYALDLTATQEQAVRQHAGAARWAYNHALAAKLAALDERHTAIILAVDVGADRTDAAKRAPKVPNKSNI